MITNFIIFGLYFILGILSAIVCIRMYPDFLWDDTSRILVIILVWPITLLMFVFFKCADWILDNHLFVVAIAKKLIWLPKLIWNFTIEPLANLIRKAGGIQ